MRAFQTSTREMVGASNAINIPPPSELGTASVLGWREERGWRYVEKVENEVSIRFVVRKMYATRLFRRKLDRRPFSEFLIMKSASPRPIGDGSILSRIMAEYYSEESKPASPTFETTSRSMGKKLLIFHFVFVSPLFPRLLQGGSSCFAEKVLLLNPSFDPGKKGISVRLCCSSRIMTFSIV